MDRSSCLLRNRPIRARNKHNRRLRCAIRVRKGPHGVREYSNRWNTVRIRCEKLRFSEIWLDLGLRCLAGCDMEI
ncbi:hypothetical protein RHGRI_000579 [Rhododendron griersonianum]|uniref:Ribosomal protein S14 n=1 Tax=Rhododendron griersonianum TaxID=479676 RepID=A0AAV6LI34_9ERIC|nr:hypothetical protein RHGRI_015239 [Rhododendron griersonianum]KAG5564437.1 hypothetical protein RHGRI_000579 [Rhododendron griersonianum]